MSPSSDTDFETGITEKIALTKKKKTKPTPIIPTDHGKNEGDDPHWAYEPPEGAQLLDHAVDAGVFEWGAVKHDEDTEIWLIRVPDSIKPKHLKGLEIDPPSSSRTARVGELSRKNASYDVWSIGDDDAEVVRAEELRSLSCLLPRQRKDGRLYIAPKRVSHHLVLSAQLTKVATGEDQHPVYENLPRPSYSKDLLRHAFVPYGARSQQSRSEDLSIDDEGLRAFLDKLPKITPSSKDRLAKTEESKGKKRSPQSRSEDLSVGDEGLRAVLAKLPKIGSSSKDKSAKTEESKGKERSQQSRPEDLSTDDEDFDAFLVEVINNASSKDKPAKIEESKEKKRSQQSRSEDLSTDDEDFEALLVKVINNASSSKDKPAKTKESKGKKRSKVDGESPRKSKKHKPNS